MPELISLLMPVRNAAPFLEETLSSIREQYYSHWELIAVDDHSNDASAAILRRYAATDPRIRLLPNPGRGIIPALERALSAARGRMVSRMDADDIMPSERLQQMATALASQPAGTVTTGQVRYFPREQLSPGYRRYENWLNAILHGDDPWVAIYRECIVASPNWLMRRDDLEKCGGMSGLHYPEDYDLVFRWYAAGYRLHALDQVTLHWREHPARSSRNSKHYKQKAFFELKVRRFVELENPGEKISLLGTGQKGKLAAKVLQGSSQGFDWYSDHPETYPQGLYGQAVGHYEYLPADQKLLIAIYPPAPQRRQMKSFLDERGMQEGREYWFL